MPAGAFRCKSFGGAGWHLAENPTTPAMTSKIAGVFVGAFLWSTGVAAQISEGGKWAVEAYTTYGFMEPNLTYATVNGTDLKLDVYRPKSKTPKPRATLVFIHGGGWQRGSKESYLLRVLPWLEKGWNVVNVEFRQAGVAKAPAAVEDCRCAVRWVIDNAEKYNFDKTKIVVSGQSSGGHLALMTGLAAPQALFDKNCAGTPVKVAAVVNWFGFVEVAELLAGPFKNDFALEWIGKDRLGQADFVKLVSPITYVSKSSPPVVTVHGNADPTHPYAQAVRLHQALDKANVANKLVTVEKGGPGDFSTDDSIKAYEAIFAFLKASGID